MDVPSSKLVVPPPPQQNQDVFLRQKYEPQANNGEAITVFQLLEYSR